MFINQRYYLCFIKYYHQPGKLMGKRYHEHLQLYAFFLLFSERYQLAGPAG